MSTTYTSISHRIANNRLFPWAHTFNETLDEKIRAAAGGLVAEKRAKSKYNSYAVEDQLNQISALLEKCLIYRRDYQDFESIAQRQVLAYELFEKQLSNARDSERAGWIKTGATNRKAGYSNVAQSFDAAQPSNSGFASWMREYERSAGDDEDAETARTALVDAKWDLLDTYQKHLNEIHQQPGGSLNYGDRADRVYHLLSQDLTEAYVRSEAAFAGLKQVFKLSPEELPSLTSEMLLDKLFDWARGSIDILNIAQEDYTDTELIIPLREHGLSKPATADGKPINKDMWGYNLDGENSPGYGPAIFDFEVNLPPTIQFARLRGIGASFYVPADHVKLQDWRGIRGGVVVFPPTTDDSLKLVGTPVLLDNVTVTDPYVPVRIKYGGNFTNIDPTGVWRLKISRLLNFPSENGPPDIIRSSSVIQNLCLHLRISCKVSNDMAMWKNLDW